MVKIKAVGEIEYEKIQNNLTFKKALDRLNNNYNYGDGELVMRLPDDTPNLNPDHAIKFGIQIYTNKLKSICLNEKSSVGSLTCPSPEDILKNKWEVWKPKTPTKPNTKHIKNEEDY